MQYRVCVCCGVVYDCFRQIHNNVFCSDCASEHRREARTAISRVSAAVASGKLPRAKDCTCVDCGRPAHDYDHRDYTEPLSVVPVCRSCNQKRGSAFSSFYRPQAEAA